MSSRRWGEGGDSTRNALIALEKRTASWNTSVPDKLAIKRRRSPDTDIVVVDIADAMPFNHSLAHAFTVGGPSRMLESRSWERCISRTCADVGTARTIEGRKSS